MREANQWYVNNNEEGERTLYSKHMYLKPLVFCNCLFSYHVNSVLLSKINLV